MKQLVTFLVIATLTVSASASNTLSVWTIGDRDGYVGAGGTLLDNNTSMFYIGDPHPSAAYFDYGVVKYALPTALTGQTILNASVNIRVIAQLEGDVYILLQKYTFDNNTAVNIPNDYTTNQVQNIGVFTATGGWMTWDVTSALQSDVNNGYQYSSYRASAVVSPIDLTPVAIEGAYYVRAAAAELTKDYPTWTGLEPRLDVEYVPEPATMSLLALGSLWLIRRK